MAYPATLAAAAFGGFLADRLGLPVGWLLGATLAVATATLAGLRTALPGRLRDLGFFILGIQAGSGVTPQIVDQLTLWPASFAIQMVGMLAVVAGTSVFLRRALGWDRETALFASIPGALSFVLATASETRADMTKVIVVQSVRLLLLIGALTPTLAWLEGGTPASLALRGGSGGTPLQYAMLFATCLVLSWIGVKSRVPGGLILGSLLGSAIMHGTEIAAVPIPQWAAIPALVVMGAVIASRLRPEDRHALLGLLPASLGAFVIGLVLSGLAGLFAMWLLAIDFAKIALAYAPGAIEALTVLAYQFNLDPAYVAAHHVVRFVGLALLVPVLARRMPRQQAAALRTPDPETAARDTSSIGDEEDDPKTS